MKRLRGIGIGLLITVGLVGSLSTELRAQQSNSGVNQTDRLFFSPSSLSPLLSQPSTTTIRLDSAQGVSIVSLVLNYPAERLRVTAVDFSGSVFEEEVEPVTDTNGELRFSRATFQENGYLGGDGLVGRISFEAIATGESSVTVAVDQSEVLHYITGDNVLASADRLTIAAQASGQSGSGNNQSGGGGGAGSNQSSNKKTSKRSSTITPIEIPLPPSGRLSDIRATVDQTEATIAWQTSEAYGYRLLFGPDQTDLQPERRLEQKVALTEHSARLSQLTPCTTYRFTLNLLTAVDWSVIDEPYQASFRTLGCDQSDDAVTLPAIDRNSDGRRTMALFLLGLFILTATTTYLMIRRRHRGVAR